MADELKLRFSATLSRGVLKDRFEPGNRSIDVSADPIAAGVMAVGTTAEALGVGDVATLGILCVHNLDATNFVEFGPDSAGTMVAVGKLKPDEYAFLRLKPGITFKLKADTATYNVRYWLLSD